jgi:GNAT superfamily N-acetyltransferase
MLIIVLHDFYRLKIRPETQTRLQARFSDELNPDEGKCAMNLKFSIRSCGLEDDGEILTVINESAKAYRGVIPADCYHEPYMPADEFRKEMSAMTFFGYEQNGKLLGAVGCQRIKDVTLVRHLYVRPEHQRRGIGTKLIAHVIRLATTPRILVGTWEAAAWAVRFYEKEGFKLLPDKDRLLREYWKISERQIELSVVLGFDKSLGAPRPPSNKSLKQKTHTHPA